MATRNPASRRRNSRTGPHKRPEFPPDFAEQLIAKEMAVDHDCCLDNINELVQLYGMAVEHYENIGDSRHIDY